MEFNTEKLQFDSVETKKYNVNVSAKELVYDGAKVLSTVAYVCCGRSEIINNEVILEGVVNFVAIVKNHDEINKIERSERFSLSEKIVSQNKISNVFASSKVRKIRAYCEANNLMLSCNVDISALFIVSDHIEYISDNLGEEYKKKTEPVKLYKNIFAKQMRFSVSECTELSPRVPEIKEILSVSAFPCVRETHVSAGQLIIGGEISVQTVYRSVDEYDPIIQINDKIDFSQIIEVSEMTANDPIVNLSVEDVNGTVSLNEQGETRVITYSIGLCGYAFANETVEKEFIVDAYSTNRRIECKNNKAEIYGISDKTSVFTNKNIYVRVPEGKAPVSRAIAVTFLPSVLSSEIVNSKANLKCSADVSVIYSASGTGENEGFNTSVEFEIFLDNILPNKCDAVITDLTLNDMQAVLLSGTELEIRTGLNIEILPQYISNAQLVTEIKESDEKDFPEFGVIIYNVQPGDTLWDISKKYGVDSEDLLKLNHELCEYPEVGQKLYIFRRLVV